MNVDGSCFCGHITYGANVDPNMVGICHCTDCQSNSGTAYGVFVAVVGGSFELQSGELKSYEKIADSGAVRSLNFCPECGTRIYATTVGEGIDLFSLRVGTVRQRDQLKPSIQIWCRSAQDWVMDLRQIPKIDKQPSF